MTNLSQLPPPPAGQKGMNFDQLSGQKGQTLEQIIAQQQTQEPDKSVGLGGTKFLGENLGALSMIPQLAESSKQGTNVQKQLDQHLASGQMSQERHDQLSKGLQPDLSSVVPKRSTGDIVRGGIKAGLDLGSLAVGGGWAESLAENTLSGAVKQGIVQGAKSGALAGGMSGLGQGVEDNQGVGHAVGQTLKGVGTGAVAGGVIGGVLPVAGKVVSKVKGAFPSAEKATQDLESAAIKDTTPSYNKKLVGESHIPNFDEKGNRLGTTPRVSEAEGTKMRTVNPRSSEIEAGKELAKVEGYNPKDTSLNKYNLVQDTITKKGQALESSLKAENVLRPPAEIKKTVRDAILTTAKDSLVLQKADPIVKNYLRVANRAVDQASGTLEGELNVRKALDTAYEDAGGKYGNNKGLDQIHRAARNAINDDLEKMAQSTQVKAALKEQSNLYRASDVLKDKARAEGGSKFEQFVKAHPRIMKIAKPIGRAAGIGAGVHLIP